MIEAGADISVVDVIGLVIGIIWFVYSVVAGKKKRPQQAPDVDELPEPEVRRAPRRVQKAPEATPSATRRKLVTRTGVAPRNKAAAQPAAVRPTVRSVLPILTAPAMRQAALAPLGAIPLARPFVEKDEVRQALASADSDPSRIPWSLVDAVRQTTRLALKASPNLQRTLVAVTGLRSDLSSVGSIEDLTENPRLLASGWIEHVFLEVLGSMALGSTWIRLRGVELAARPDRDVIVLDVRRNVLSLRPPAAVLIGIYDEIVEELGWPENESLHRVFESEMWVESFTLRVVGGNEPFEVDVPASALVEISRNWANRLINTRLEVLGCPALSSVAGEIWATRAHEVSAWRKRLASGEAATAPSIPLFLAFVELVAEKGFGLAARSVSEGVSRGPAVSSAVASRQGSPGNLADPQGLLEGIILGAALNRPGNDHLR